MVNACADPDFFVREGGGGGGGSKPNSEKIALIFYVWFWGFLVQNFPGMRGGIQLFTGGSKCQISDKIIELVIYQGWGSRFPTPPPSGSAHA